MQINKWLCGVFGLLLSCSVQAQTPSELKQIMERPSMYTDQAILDLIPQVDPLYHQYVFPAFHKVTTLSHRLRTMPEIAQWKDKVPTRIAQELQGKDPYNWRYLSPFLYIYLMPELWPSYYREKKEAPKPIITRQVDWTNPQEAERAFSPSKRADEIRQELQRKARENNEPGLSEQDVKMVHQVLSDLIEVSETPDGRAVFAHVALALDADKVYEAMAHPCASLAERIQTIGMDSFFTPSLEKAQVSREEFIDKCERVTRAYRVAHSSPQMALYVVNLQRKLAKNPAMPKNCSKASQQLSTVWKR